MKFCGVLEVLLNVLESIKFIEYTLFRHHGNCSMTRSFSGFFVENVIENSLFTSAKNYSV